MISFLVSILITFVLFNLVYTSPAYGYLDPGTISMALQVVIACIAGVFMFFKFGLSKVLGVFAKLFSRSK